MKNGNKRTLKQKQPNGIHPCFSFYNLSTCLLWKKPIVFGIMAGYNPMFLNFSDVYIWLWIVYGKILFIIPTYSLLSERRKACPHRQLALSLSASLSESLTDAYSLTSRYILSLLPCFPLYFCTCGYKSPPLVFFRQFYSLAVQIEGFKRPSILPTLLMDFVSQYCFKLPKEKKCLSRKRF